MVEAASLYCLEVDSECFSLDLQTGRKAEKTRLIILFCLLPSTLYKGAWPVLPMTGRTAAGREQKVRSSLPRAGGTKPDIVDPSCLVVIREEDGTGDQTLTCWEALYH